MTFLLFELVLVLLQPEIEMRSHEIDLVVDDIHHKVVLRDDSNPTTLAMEICALQRLGHGRCRDLASQLHTAIDGYLKKQQQEFIQPRLEIVAPRQVSEADASLCSSTC